MKTEVLAPLSLNEALVERPCPKGQPDAVVDALADALKFARESAEEIAAKTARPMAVPSAAKRSRTTLRKYRHATKKKTKHGLKHQGMTAFNKWALEQMEKRKEAGNRREDAEAQVKRTGRALLTPGRS